MRHDTMYERHAPPDAALDAALADTRLGAYWLDDAAPQRVRRPALSGERTTDLAIIGGGFTGLWTALHAKRRDPDRRVMILEARRVAWAASGRNGGWIDYSLTHGEENGLARWPDEFETLQRLGYDNLDGYEHDLAEHGIDADFARVGALHVAVEAHQVPWLSELETREQTTLDAEAARARINAPGILGAIHETGRMVATAHPAKLAYGLAAAAERLGVEILERSRVRGLDTTSPGEVVLRLDDGRVRAHQVVLATNAFPALLRRNRRMTVPVYDYAIMTEPLPTDVRAAIGWQGREAVGDLSSLFHYSQITPEGRILWGGYDAVYIPGGRIRRAHEDDPALHRKLVSHLYAFLPQLAEAGVRITHRWAGVIDTSTRFAVFTGLAKQGRIAYAAGYTGLGVGTARFAAEVMLDRLAGLTTERTELRMMRTRGVPFPPEPAATIGIGLSRWSMAAADHHEGRRGAFLRAMDALGLGFDS